MFKQPGGALERTVLSHSPDQIVLCSVVKAELWHGAQKYERTDRRLAVLNTLFASFVSFPFDDDAAAQYGTIRHELETAGCVIGPNDLMIAAICVAKGLTLVTSNTAEFSRIPGLRFEDWSV